MDFEIIITRKQAGALPKLMPDLGFDEIRAILDPLGQKIFDLIGEANRHAVMRGRSNISYPKIERARDFREFPNKAFRYVRCHNMFTGDGGDRQGAKNAGLVDISYDQDGLHCNFDRLDAAYQTFIEAGCLPFVELGFTPPALAINAKEAHAYPQPDARDEIYDLKVPEDLDDNPRMICNAPPRSFTLWEELVRKTILHLQEKFGAEVIRDWLFELWNEPDLMNFWSSMVDDYCEMFERTARVIKDIDPELRIGGPSIAGSTQFLKQFLDYVVIHDVPLDFISGHVKGGNPKGYDYPNSDIMLFRMHEYIETIGKVKPFTEMDGKFRVPLLLNEADAFLACVNGIIDNEIYSFREKTYYPCFIARYYHLLINYLNEEAPPWFSLHGAYSDNVHMVDDYLPFGGFRCTTTTVPVDRSLANHADIIVPPTLSDGPLEVPDHAKKWTKYSQLVDRQRLFSVYPMHPAWNEPFIIVKKPVFFIYELLQMLGPEKLEFSIQSQLTDDKKTLFDVIPTISNETKEIIILGNYFEPNPKMVHEAIKVRILAPHKFTSGEVDAFFKSIRCYELSPATCDAFNRWNDDWSTLESIQEEQLEDLLKYNRLNMSEQKVEVSGETIIIDREISINSVITWVLKYE